MFQNKRLTDNEALMMQDYHLSDGAELGFVVHKPKRPHKRDKIHMKMHSDFMDYRKYKKRAGRSIAKRRT